MSEWEAILLLVGRDLDGFCKFICLLHCEAISSGLVPETHFIQIAIYSQARQVTKEIFIEIKYKTVPLFLGSKLCDDKQKQSHLYIVVPINIKQILQLYVFNTNYLNLMF